MSSANSFSSGRSFSPSKDDKQEILDTASSAASPPRYDPLNPRYEPGILDTIYKDLPPPSPQPKDEISPKPKASKYVTPKIFSNIPSPSAIAARVPYAGYTLTEPNPPKEEIQGIFERRCHWHILAMKHYNDTRKEGEDEYKLSTSSIPKRMVQPYIPLGFLHKLMWEGKPISTEKSDSAKYFFGAVHEMNPDEMHVAYAKRLKLDRFLDLSPAQLPTRCERCDIKDHDDFRQRDQDLEDRVKKNASMSFCLGSSFRDGLDRITPARDSNRYEGGGMEEEMHKKNCDDAGVIEDETPKKKANFEEGSEKLQGNPFGRR
ncbi:uncharacterized protein LOC107628099 isoform X3 [Arachis ipaensis]|uniref:uncharacterized protein LOC107628099 isoform X3 n=1 Tax=Arachis ipaensis TaxID=130454 RepID=UPI0007AF707E|nr:uncharacterized protein LOC107628099 isoform X3 [Arachis ipaensis]XP_025631376.1 uncharacterized protein LOC112726267 isoform X3 [Arachis hypogaea]